MSKEVTEDMLKKLSATEDLARVGKVVDEIVKGLEEAKVNERIYETVFTSYFLHGLFSSGEMSDSLKHDWITLAGGPYREVDIVDNNNNVLFTVPGLVSRPTQDFDKLQKIMFANVAAGATNAANRIPEDGVRYLKRGLGDLPALVVTKDMSTDLVRWIAIRDRYQLAPNNPVAEEEDKIEDNLSGYINYE